jgi:photosystem II stability/assembly factor-like uncharacterized protein
MQKIKIIKKAFFLFPVLFLFILSCQNAENTNTDYDIKCYAATYGEGIYQSDNGGKSWYPMKMDQEHIHLYFKRLFLDPGKDTLYIATTGAGLFSIDLKKNMFQDIEQYKGQNIRTVAFTGNMESEKHDVFVGMFEEGISKISAEENSYLNKGLTYRDVNTIITSGNDIFAGTVKDVFKWDNKNKTWLSSSQGIKNKNIISLAAAPKGDILYAGAGGYYDKKGMFESVPCLYISKDNGKTWKESEDGLSDDTLVYSIAVNAAKPERIYLGTSDGIYMSDDSGDDWSKTDDGLPDDFRVFDIRIKHMTDGNDTVYAAGSKGIFMAVDTDDPVWISKNYGLPKTNITGIVLK